MQNKTTHDIKKKPQQNNKNSQLYLAVNIFCTPFFCYKDIFMATDCNYNLMRI